MKTLKLIIFLFVGTLIFSCDISKRCLIGNRYEYYLNTDCGNVEISVFKLQRNYFLHQEFSGEEFTVCMDSLEIALFSDKFDIGELKWNVQTKKTDQFTDSCFIIKGNFTVSTSFFLIIKDNIDPNNLSKNDVLQILPCNYIMCNGEPVIKDTINIDLGIQITPSGKIRF